MYGKTIEIFLVNGTSESIVTAELSNWNGKAIKIPRNEVLSCDREDIKGAGVYFLFCQNEDGKDSVYIGEAENILDRLKQHISSYESNGGGEQYYWNTAISFAGRDLNKADIRYLENRLVEITKESARCEILTKKTYKKTVMKESAIAVMEEFISNIRVLLGALGYKILVPAPQANEGTKYLYCKGNGIAEATGFISSGGITVLKGSRISDDVAPYFKEQQKSYYKLRQKLENDGTIVDKKFTRNYEFTAPSAASSVILGHNSNGKAYWKDDEGLSLKDM